MCGDHAKPRSTRSQSTLPIPLPCTDLSLPSSSTYLIVKADSKTMSIPIPAEVAQLPFLHRYLAILAAVHGGVPIPTPPAFLTQLEDLADAAADADVPDDVLAKIMMVQDDVVNFNYHYERNR